MTLKPWAIGPFELLQHAEGHRLGQGDFDRRMALISFDNAIESSVTTFLSLDPIQRGGRQYPREDVAKWMANFHSKLAFLEQHASSVQVSMKQDRAAMVFYHRLRNELYHDGNGAVPAERHLIGIRESAVWTFSLLFECDAEALLASEVSSVPSARDASVQLSAATTFLQAFLSARQALTDLAYLQRGPASPTHPLQDSLKDVAAKEQDSLLASFVDDLQRAEQVTNALVDDARIDSGPTDLSELTQKLKVLSTKLTERLRKHQHDIVLAAIHATLRAAAGNRRAGVIRQAEGSGRITSLVAYVAACRDESNLPFRQHVVVFDRALLVDQFVKTYNDWLSIAAPPAREARGRGLAKLLQDTMTGPIVTTVQQILLQNCIYDHECLVAYDGLTSPSARLADHFPQGTFIRFASVNHTEASQDDQWFGKLIYAYDFPQAIQDGLLLPVTIHALPDDTARHEVIIGSRLFSLHNARSIEQQVQAIIADYRQHPQGKAIILGKDAAHVKAMAAHINATFTDRQDESKESASAVAIGSFMNGSDLQQTIQQFQWEIDSPTFLVMTPPRLIGMDSPVVQTCYVTCKVSTTTQKSIISLVSRPLSNKRCGRVVDYMSNLWDMFDHERQTT